MDSDSWLPYLILALFIILGGYFAATGTAFASINKLRLKNLADAGSRRARRVLVIQSRFDKAENTLLIGGSLMRVFAAVLAAWVAVGAWGEAGALWSALVVTGAAYLFGHLLPESYAESHPEDYAMAASGPLNLLTKLLTPLTALVAGAAGLLARLMGPIAGPRVTEDELYDIIDEIEQEGTIDRQQSGLIRSALDFSDITVADILTSRVDLVAIDAAEAPEEIVSLIKQSRHSRLPVYEDTIDNVVGVLGIRRYLKAYIAQKGRVDLRSQLDKPYFVQRTMPIDALLGIMQSRRLHMAMVGDDHGGLLGIVTMEDILEELVGEIWDEDDEVRELFKSIGGGRFEVSGDMPVRDAFDAMGFGGYDSDELGHRTMNAWALENFDGAPGDGSFTYADMTVTVARIRNMRISKLLIKREGGGADGQ